MAALVLVMSNAFSKQLQRGSKRDHHTVCMSENVLQLQAIIVNAFERFTEIWRPNVFDIRMLIFKRLYSKSTSILNPLFMQTNNIYLKEWLFIIIHRLFYIIFYNLFTVCYISCDSLHIDMKWHYYRNSITEKMAKYFLLILVQIVET